VVRVAEEPCASSGNNLVYTLAKLQSTWNKTALVTIMDTVTATQLFLTKPVGTN
jgi:hypothetical protein